MSNTYFSSDELEELCDSGDILFGLSHFDDASRCFAKSCSGRIKNEQ